MQSDGEVMQSGKEVMQSDGEVMQSDGKVMQSGIEVMQSVGEVMQSVGEVMQSCGEACRAVGVVGSTGDGRPLHFQDRLRRRIFYTECRMDTSCMGLWCRNPSWSKLSLWRQASTSCSPSSL